MRTIAQKYIEEGKLEGKLEVARNLLKSGMPASIISKTTDLPISKIRKLEV